MDATRTTRLIFDGASGLLIKGMLSVALDRAPPVPVPHVRAISYWPHRGEVRVSGQGWRTMTRAECDAVRDWLDLQESNIRQSLGRVL